MAFNFLGFIYTKIFINIVVENLTTIVYVEVYSSKGTLMESIEKKFDVSQDKTRMYNFIKSYKKESPFHYISIIDHSSTQCAVSTCKINEIDNLNRDSKIKLVCYAKDLAFYTLESSINSIKREYKEVGVDFIFSPFLIMREFFKDKIELTMAMFILVEESYLSLAIFENSKLLFAKFINADHLLDEEENPYDSQLLDDDSEELSLDMGEIDLDDVGFAEEYASIENLDDSDDINEFSEESEIKKPLSVPEEKLTLNGFGEDYQRFVSIQESLNSFYKDEKYDSRFVEVVYIADAIGLNHELKGYLEDEMFLSVYSRKIELAKEICNLAKIEIK
ncbi:hypothetical protein [Sulfurimonas sp.]|uniref:hypothetical protein n=1 Tax=Sulfurimonas sp. TaxID=2022749 RepID=UPI0025D842B0|nr:hypothetical protein [Sulfurimonas sp.]